MICVSIGHGRHKMITAEHRHLAERGVSLVEYRLDRIQRVPSMRRLFKEPPATPVIMTCRRSSDQGQWRWSEAQRLAVLREAIVFGADYVDLETDVADRVARYGSTKRIVSYHDFEQTPDDLEAIHARMCEQDADIIKIVTMATCPADNVRMLKLVASASKPTVGFCMGEYGVVSRILCGRYGSPFTYACVDRRQQVAPGQVAWDEMRDLYRFDEITPETDLFGVLGDPVGHSMSPLIHNTSFARESLNATYLPFHVTADQLQDTLDQFEWIGVKGYSVTIPHKQAVIQRADERAPAVDDIGAANTLYRDNERWHAANTDYDAALQSVLNALPMNGDLPATLNGKTVLMLGAGGVARAIGLAMIRSGATVTITNRTAQRASDLANELGCDHLAWDQRHTVLPDVLINCTSAGMSPLVDESPFAGDCLAAKTLVFDTVYNPETTLLLRQAQAAGCRTVSGVEMFVRQAARQFELFTQRTAPLELMRTSVQSALAEKHAAHSQRQHETAVAAGSLPSSESPDAYEERDTADSMPDPLPESPSPDAEQDDA